MELKLSGIYIFVLFAKKPQSQARTVNEMISVRPHLDDVFRAVAQLSKNKQAEKPGAIGESKDIFEILTMENFPRSLLTLEVNLNAENK